MISSAQKAGGGKPRHIPQRTCVGCRQVRPKRDMVRIVRTPEGEIVVDPSGKRSGRGAYICPGQECWEAALKRERLERSLHAAMPQEQRRLIAEQGSKLISKNTAS